MLKRMRLRAEELIHDEAGDVPGWVLITIMTAALVMVIWAFAGPALIDLVDNALKGVQFS